jgi:general secretion pathway protein G
MTTAAESSGAEVQQSRSKQNRLRSNMPFFLGCLVTLGVFLAAMLTPICGCDDDTGRVRADVKVLEINVIRYKTMMNRYPNSLEDLVRRPDNLSGNWRELMSKEALLDRWGEPYQLRQPSLEGNIKGYDVFSKGPDKTEGTPDDIGNW